MSHYNTELIETNIARFKTIMKDYSGERTILFDADNTLYQFSTYGNVAKSLSLCYSKGFFKNLPIFAEAPIVIENLQRLGLRCGIISALVDSPFCNTEKRESFGYYFPMIKPEDIYLIPEGTNKTSVIKDVEHTILVDDFHGNINDWYEAGGIAIKKSYSGKPRPVPVVTSLIDLFPILHELNVY